MESALLIVVSLTFNRLVPQHKKVTVTPCAGQRLCFEFSDISSEAKGV